MRHLLYLALVLWLFVFAAAPALGKSFEQVYREAEQGDADAQASLGAMYYTGQGVAYDYGQAHKWLLKAAEQGNAEAQASVGGMYSLG